MATIQKRSAKLGDRWLVRIRKSNHPTITRTSSYKARAETWAKETERMRLFKIARHTVAKIPIRQLQSLHIAQYRDQRLNEVSGSTVKKELNLLFHAIETARGEWNYHIPHNPIVGVQKPKGNRARERRLSEYNTSRLPDTCRSSGNP